MTVFYSIPDVDTIIEMSQYTYQWGFPVGEYQFKYRNINMSMLTIPTVVL